MRIYHVSLALGAHHIHIFAPKKMAIAERVAPEHYEGHPFESEDDAPPVLDASMAADLESVKVRGCRPWLFSRTLISCL